MNEGPEPRRTASAENAASVRSCITLLNALVIPSAPLRAQSSVAWPQLLQEGRSDLERFVVLRLASASPPCQCYDTSMGVRGR